MRTIKRKLQGIFRLRPWGVSGGEPVEVWVRTGECAAKGRGCGICPSPEEKVEESRRYKDEGTKRLRTRTGRHDDHVTTAAYRQRNARDSLLGRTSKTAGDRLGSALRPLTDRVEGDEHDQEPAAGARPGGPLCRPASLHGPLKRAVHASGLDAHRCRDHRIYPGHPSP